MPAGVDREERLCGKRVTMRTIRKNVVTDEARNPIAVQIAYADWLEIEHALDLREENGKTVDLSPFSGTIRLTEDPLEYQARIRREWS
jgi:hypothetical protein